MKKNQKIYLAGHKGLVGSAVNRALIRQGYKNIIMKSHIELPLDDEQSVNKFFKKENSMNK